MKIYLDGKPVAQDADAAALEAALARFKNLGHKAVTLEREHKRRLTIRRWGDQLMAEVETPQSLQGVAVRWDEAARMARDYREGLAVKLAWTPPPGAKSVVVGDQYHPDCPLCKAGA